MVEEQEEGLQALEDLGRVELLVQLKQHLQEEEVDALFAEDVVVDVRREDYRGELGEEQLALGLAQRIHD